jgi:hypothetical protein
MYNLVQETLLIADSKILWIALQDLVNATPLKQYDLQGRSLR